ncbi:MAG: POTRA domain-containing protein [Acidobacteriota bacterium]
MVLRNLTTSVFILLLSFSANQIAAQNTDPQSQPKSLKSADFVDDETGVENIVFSGLETQKDEFGEPIEDTISESDLRSALRRQGGPETIQRENYVLGLERVDNTIKAINEYLSLHGYLKAKITALGEKTGQGRMKLIFAIEKGKRFTVSSVAFNNLVTFSNDELVPIMKDCMGDRWGLYDLRQIDYCAQKKVRNLMQSRGYFEAKISPAERRFHLGEIEIFLDVTEGLRYRLGEIKVKGAEAFSKQEILDMLGQKTGDVADGNALQDLVYEKLKHAYDDKGYVQYSSEFEPVFFKPEGKSLDGTVNIKIDIDEGRVFKVRRIQFVGIDAERGNQLTQSLSLKEKSPFNRTKFEQDIKDLNTLGDFESIDQDQDVDFLTDEESADIVIRITVKPVS